MSMSDDTLQSYRSSDAAPDFSARNREDPLAELARLIGRSESLSDGLRSQGRGAKQAAPVAPALAPDEWQYPSSEHLSAPGSRADSAEELHRSTQHGYSEQYRHSSEEHRYSQEQDGGSAAPVGADEDASGAYYFSEDAAQLQHDEFY